MFVRRGASTLEEEADGAGLGSLGVSAGFGSSLLVCQLPQIPCRLFAVSCVQALACW